MNESFENNVSSAAGASPVLRDGGDRFSGASPSQAPLPDFADYNTERAVLAAVLADPANLNTVLSTLGGVTDPALRGGNRKKNAPGAEKDSAFQHIARVLFRDPKHAMIYEAILDLQSRQNTVDVLSLSQHLQRTGRLEMIGGLNALIELQDTIGSTANLEAWCGILRDYAMLRQMLRACRNAEELCRHPSGDIKSLLDDVEDSLFQVRNSFVQPEIKDIRTLLIETFDYFNRLLKREIEPGIPTGFPDLDNLTGGGLKKQEMFVLAARPSIGKTALALNIVRNIVMKEIEPRKRVMFFSLEMSGELVVQRLLCTEAGIPLSSIMDGTFNYKNEISKLTSAVTVLSKTKLRIDPTGGISIYELRAKARKEKDMNGLDLIVIDYLQLMKAPEAAKDSRQAEVAAISGGLKKLAKDLDVPVLVLAQLNRETEKGQGGGKNARPKLSNLRESGAIEQDADVVVFLHRDRDEAKENRQAENGGSHGPVKAELIVEKNRNGKTGIVELEFVPSLMVFRPILHSYARSDIPAAAKPRDASPDRKERT